MYQMKRLSKRWIFFITPAIYLVYMAGAGIVFAFANQAWRSYFGPASWVFLLMIGAVSPLASLFFTILPTLVMVELMIIFVLVFLCIVPLCNPAGNLWDMISVASDVAIETEAVSCTLSSVFAMIGWLTCILTFPPAVLKEFSLCSVFLRRGVAEESRGRLRLLSRNTIVGKWPCPQSLRTSLSQ